MRCHNASAWSIRSSRSWVEDSDNTSLAFFVAKNALRSPANSSVSAYRRDSSRAIALRTIATSSAGAFGARSVRSCGGPSLTRTITACAVMLVAREQVVDQCAQCVPVGARREFVDVSACLFGRHVRQRAHHVAVHGHERRVRQQFAGDLCCESRRRRSRGSGSCGRISRHSLNVASVFPAHSTPRKLASGRRHTLDSCASSHARTRGVPSEAQRDQSFALLPVPIPSC